MIAFVCISLAFILAKTCSEVVTKHFSYTGSVQRFVVPEGVRSVEVEIGGATGGSDECGLTRSWNGGYGHTLKATINIPEGTPELFVYVGGRGTDRRAEDCHDGLKKSGGFNGGGSSGLHFGGGGGGASDIRIHPEKLSSRLIVAGAGAGASAICEYDGNN